MTRRRLAVVVVATSLAAATGTAQATPAPMQPSAQWVTASRTGVVKPPANVTALARDLGVDTNFAWKTLDELAKGS